MSKVILNFNVDDLDLTPEQDTPAPTPEPTAPKTKPKQTPAYINVSDGTKDAGFQTYWSISGPTNIAAFTEAWLAAGLPSNLLPTPQTDEYNLRTAMVKLTKKRFLLRPLAKEGFALVAEKAEEDALEHSQKVTARVVTDTSGATELAITPPDHPLADQIKANYAQSKLEWTVDHVSSWLVKLSHRHDSVNMRTMGGIYFMPPAATVSWEQIAETIEANTPHTVYRIPTMNTKGAMKAILDAVINDATEKADAIHGDLHSGRSGDLGKRALQGRVGQADALLGKLESYEEVLGSALDSIKGRLLTLRADAVAAVLLAEDAK